MRVCFTNLGCKLNQAELEAMARRFHAAGHDVVSTPEEAELHVINSCTVTHMAARDSRKIARRGHRRNAGLRTVVTGCYASEQPAEAAAVAGVDLVVTNDRKEQLLELVHEAFPDAVPAPRPLGVEGPVPVPYVPLEFGNTRSLIKVEDGCNMRCSFCIIPSTRGRQHSRPLADCVEEVRQLTAAGAREVVVTGVQISSYRHGDHRLCDLVRALLEETEVPRLRLTSIAPWQFDERLLELWQDRRLCRHVHMSLQSGDSDTLRRMRRPYTAAAYRSVVDGIRRAVPGVAITTDVIVGFPGETEAEFESSLGFTREMAFARIHAFPYSSRPGTLAADLDGHIDPGVKRQRMARMLEVARDAEKSFWQGQLGAAPEVLWEGRRQGLWRGMTDNYVRVFTRSSADLHNRLVTTRLTGLADGGVLGELAA